MDRDKQKCYTCSPKTRCIIVGFTCLVLYTAALAIVIYLYCVARTPDIILQMLVGGLPLMLLLISILIFGVYTEKPNFMLPWLVVKFLSLVILSIFLVFFCGTTIVALIKKRDEEIGYPFLISLFSVGISWFFHWSIYKYYKSLTEDEHNTYEGH